jgi:hypothetical protein
LELCIPALHDKILAFDVAVASQASNKPLIMRRVFRWKAGHEQTNADRLARILRESGRGAPDEQRQKSKE